LKKNFYYIVQKFIINYSLQNIFQNNIGNYRKTLDLIVEELLNLKIDENSDIKSHIEFCYLIKLKAFADERNVEIKTQQKPSQDINYLPNIEDDPELDKNNINTNSFDLGNDYNDDKNDLKMKESLKSKDENNNNDDKKWFPLIKKKFKYLLEQDELSLNNFLNDIEKQDSFFNQNSDDTTFTSLNSIINKDLLYFINKNKKDFISHLIDKIYSNQKFTYNINICSEIIMKQDFKSIYEQKLIHEFELLINNNEFTKIEYLTI